jgi:hypothetical protein
MTALEKHTVLLLLLLVVVVVVVVMLRTTKGTSKGVLVLLS